MYDPDKPSLDELSHFGVKGMKWGVKKKYYQEHMDEDRVISKKTTISNISADKAREIRKDAPIYTYNNQNDKQAYAGHYAKQMLERDKKAIENTIELKKDLKIPSQKKAVETFMEMYKADPVGISNSIGKAYAELDYFNRVDKIRNMNSNRISKKLQNKGEDWIQNKGYLMFNQAMMSEKEQTARVKYYDMLSKKGYNALLDVNDIQTGYNTKDPVILINPKNTVKNIKSRELTVAEIELASARYDFDKASKNRSLIDTLVFGEYAEAKKNLKKAEKKYGNK